MSAASGQMSDAEKIDKIKEYKDRGNAAYKMGQFREAAGSYHRALLYVKGLSVNCPDLLSGLAGAAPNEPRRLPPGQEDAVHALTCDCYNNLAACMLKDQNPKYERIVELCNKALDASPSNVKALYRKGTSQYALGDFDNSLNTLLQAPQDDVSVKKYVDLSKEGIKRQEKELAKCYKGMFKFS